MGRGGGRGGRARTQRRHFRQNRENVWKRSKSDPSSDPSSDPNQNDNNSNNDGTSRDRHWEPFSTQNHAFDEYYKEQGIVSTEEWDSFIGVLRTPLPAAFRINSSSQFYKDIRAQLESDFMINLQAEVSDGGEVEAIRPLPWYPENLAWHSNFSRMQLRKNQNLERFHEFLKLENEIGNITRQEAVSMVPPLFLDVSSEHSVLDMCAAPGSKTFQLLEIVYHSSKPGFLPSGLIVANDLDVQRCNLLIHQTKRMCTANLIVTNHEAQHFPGCRLKNHSDASGTANRESVINQLLFDRVLCDVPCSGDGTLRKAPDIWRKWNAGMGNGVHSLQVQIAMRGLHLLKVGGRMVYSTCSMNPVENEAVVAEILRKCGGAVELVDVSTELPQLVRRPGLKKWKVRDKGAWFPSYKNVPKYRRNLIVPSMFPSGRGDVDATNDIHQTTEPEEELENSGNGNCEEAGHSAENTTTPADELVEEVSDFPLDLCMRIAPHDQNTGAFFIAVLSKQSPLPVAQEKPDSQKEKSTTRNNEDLPNQAIENSDALDASSADATNGKLSEVASDVELIDGEPNEEAVLAAPDLSTTSEENNLEAPKEPVDKASDANKAGGKRKLQMQGKWKGVDPVLFFKDEAIINSIKAFYGIDESFPLAGHLVARNLDNNHVKRIYYISKSVKDVLELNFAVGQQLKIASIGLKMFERQTSREGNSRPCAFRISSEGLPVILPHVTKQIVHASPVDFKHLLQYKSIKYTDFVDSEFGNKASGLLQGCCVVVMRKDGQAPSDAIQVDESTIAIGCWKGRASLTVMVTAIDCQELLERLAARAGFRNGSSVKQEGLSELDVDKEKSGDDVEKIGDEETIETDA